MAIKIRSTIKCDDGMNFPVVEAMDVSVDSITHERLSEVLKRLPQYMSQEEYDALEYKDPETPYFIIKEL